MKLILSTQAKNDLKRITGYIAHRSKDRTVARNFKIKYWKNVKNLPALKEIGVARPDLTMVYAVTILEIISFYLCTVMILLKL